MELNRPRRTREHVIASQSFNYIEKFFIDKGHTVDQPGADYGYDAIVTTFDEQGYAENGDIRIQLKASHELQFNQTRSFISFSITKKHYDLWSHELMPVFLILYDAKAKAAYWVYFQEFFESDPSRKPGADARSFTLRIPADKTFSEATVDYARECKARILKQIQGRIAHGG